MQPKHELIRQKLCKYWSNWNENTEKNYKQNKDGQNEKRKNTGNMWDSKHNIVGTKEKNRMEHAHIENGRRSTSKKSSWRNPWREETPRSTDEKMERRTWIYRPPAYKKRRRSFFFCFHTNLCPLNFRFFCRKVPYIDLLVFSSSLTFELSLRHY